MTATAAPVEARAAGLGPFEKWLSVWVGAAILAGDIIIVSMIFVEEHVRAIADVLEARRAMDEFTSALRQF